MVKFIDINKIYKSSLRSFVFNNSEIIYVYKNTNRFTPIPTIHKINNIIQFHIK